MKAHELFGVIVRTFGLCLIFLGVSYAWGLVAPGQGRQGSDYLPSVILFIGAGLFAFLGADIVVRIAYWRNKP